MSLDAEASKSTRRVPAAWAHVNEALGARFVTVPSTNAVPVAPSLSVTVSVIRYVRVPSAYMCVAVGPGLVAPSPQAMLEDAIVPSRSDDARPSALNVSNVSAESGVTLRGATGGRVAPVTEGGALSAHPK